MPRQKKQKLKQRKDGRYCCKYKGIQFLSYDEDECLRLRDEYKKQQLTARELFSVYAQGWLKAYKNHLTTGPYNTHVRNLNRFTDLCGDRMLTDYKPSDISAYYQMFAGKSASSINSAKDTIKGVFRAAYEDGMIIRDPTESVKPPKGSKGTHRAITNEERQLIHTVDHRLRPAALVMLYAGLRKGEALALDIDRDIDFKNKTITVREAVRFSPDGKPQIVDPKTEAGTRVIPMLDILYDNLCGKHGLLCKSADGKRMTESAFRRAWSSYLTALSEYKNGGKKRWARKWEPVEIRAHDLRHSFCTMLYDAGVDLKTAMLWMGHADQTMTLKIYTHLSEERQKEAEKALRDAEKTRFRMQNGMQLLNVSRETIDI